MKWAHESEYRLAVPLGFGEKDWNTLSYHPEEITELYLGAKISEELRTEIVNLAKAVNPRSRFSKSPRTPMTNSTSSRTS
jgi:hypothetical protein